ncbi:MAG: hypothetical protein FWC46_09215 [Actinomycetia bacterium]|nr:hypothetical protein [Actinomycetes bacterium]
MAFTGMEVSAIRGLSRSLTDQARELDSVTSQVSALVNEATRSWQGADIADFRNQWYSSLRGRLQSASGNLKGMGSQLGRQADEQEKASEITRSIVPQTPIGGIPGEAASLLGLLGGFKDLASIVMKSNTLRKFIQMAGFERDWQEFSKIARYLAPLADHKVYQSGYRALVDKFGWLSEKLAPLGKFGAGASKVVRVAGKALGPIGGAISIGTGVARIIDGNGHEGWVDVGDRIAGGLNVVGGAAMVALPFVIGIPVVGEVVAAVAIGTTLVSAAWDFAQWCNDGGLKSAGDSLSNWADGLKNSTAGGLGGSLTRTAGTVAGAIGSGMSAVGGWLKGLW